MNTLDILRAVATGERSAREVCEAALARIDLKKLSWWQRKALDALAGRSPVGSDERNRALRTLTLRYAENQRSGDPVHTWEVPTPGQG